MQDKRKKVSIIIPVYNERDTILKVLERIEHTHMSFEKEIIIVDDGSTDGTTDILKKFGQSKYKIIFKNRNEGKGAAIKAGLSHMTGEIVIFQDADLEYDPRDYAALLKPILQGKTEAVLGARIQPKNDMRKRRPVYWLSVLGNATIASVTNALFKNNAEEYESGYKAFTARLLDEIEVRADGFNFDNELICKILKRGYKTIDVPVRYYPRGYKEGKKIKWHDGFSILLTIIKQHFFD